MISDWSRTGWLSTNQSGKVHTTVRLPAVGVAGITGGAEGYKSGTWKKKERFLHSFFSSITTSHKCEQYIALHTVGELHLVSCDPKEPIGRLLIRIDQEIIVVAMRLPWVKKNVDLEPKTGDEPHDSNFIEKKLGLSKKGA